MERRMTFSPYSVREDCNLSPSHRFAAGPSLSLRERDSEGRLVKRGYRQAIR
jgi:hypothetical protein